MTGTTLVETREGEHPEATPSGPVEQHTYLPFHIRFDGKDRHIFEPLLLLLDGRHGSEAISKQLAPIIMPGLQTNDGLQGQLKKQLTVPLGSKVFVDRVVWDMRAAVDESNIYASTVAGDLGLPWVSAAVISKRLKEILDQVWKDEHLMANEGRLVTPLISSVLYLTGTAQNPQRQGPTVILDQRFDAELGAVTPPSPAWSTLSFPLAGNYCLFDGALGHGVLDAGDEAEMRATLLINWWQHRPEAVGRAPLMPAQAEAAEGGDAGLGSDARRKLADLCLGERALPIPSIAVDAARLAGEDDMLLPDNLLAENGVALHGPGAVHAVTFHHQGLSLCPIDGGEGLSIAAALVLAQDGESSSESGDEE
ncbi:hypothetical protein APUTEX25_001772 [Auxenochlorella protothecoides]|uniref:Uncharacterized protein n=1 Tax=Auxenochlorella protothecoides TaxID=3075 RepID=A0A3M7L7P0_AUXPR|nr:hypothetical protein APUTEX25_001772 [Auxenochlorella protothecoides]|eukprot:RMZ57572.1 hypothetical protein APUTEX25_001772 [Auxenochlorella protothecoides]